MATVSKAKSKASPPLTLFQKVGMAVAVLAFAIPWVVQFDGLSPEGHRLLSVMLLAVVLWITEAIPLYATTTVIIILEILLISDKSLLSLSPGFNAPAYKVFFATLADPILMLFLGGFVLADCSSKFALDRNLGRVLIKPFGTRPVMIMLGFMLITALLSMFMSNTATTASMMAVVLPVMAQFPPGDKMRTGLILSIPFAANIGGMGTPIGTPPNAIAIGALAREGINIGFLQWMIMLVPFVLVLLVVCWLLISWLFPSNQKSIVLKMDSKFTRSRDAVLFYVVFAATVILWMTEKLHGVSSGIVGFFPVVILLSTRVFTSRDLQNIQWHVLWLLGGGIALGLGVAQTGLDSWLVGLVDWQEMSSWLLVAMFAGVALVFGTFISHTATANLLVPLGMSLATSGTVSLNPALSCVFIAVGASLAMALPISTPPNAIAMSSGTVATKNMALVGSLIGLLGCSLVVISAKILWTFLGVLPS